MFENKFWRYFLISLLLVVIFGFIFYTVFMPMFGKKSEQESFVEVQKVFAELQDRDDLSQATFAGGCFWCMEGPFQETKGVEEAIAGYSGGDAVNPNYEQVLSGGTGHRESVRIYFDPEKVTYQQLLDIYWLQIDPTDSGGQFSDRGEQYKTSIYYHDEKQQELAKDSKETLDSSGRYDKKIVTEILPIGDFYPAEDYHQNFYKNSADRYKSYSNLSGRKKYIDEIKKKLGK